MNITVKVGNVEVKVEDVTCPQVRGMEPHWARQLETMIRGIVRESMDKALEAESKTCAVLSADEIRHSIRATDVNY